MSRKVGEALFFCNLLERQAAEGLSDRKPVIELTPGGSRILRLSVCEDCAPDSLGLRAPQLFCPVCRLWPAIARTTAAGEALLPSWTARKVKELRSFAQTKKMATGKRKKNPFFPESSSADPGGRWLARPAPFIGTMALRGLSALLRPWSRRTPGRGLDFDRGL